MPYCTQCGNSLRDAALYCDQCGNPSKPVATAGRRQSPDLGLLFAIGAVLALASAGVVDSEMRQVLVSIGVTAGTLARVGSEVVRQVGSAAAAAITGLVFLIPGCL